MADIGSLVANLMLNDAQFNKSITSASRKTQSFSAKSNQYLAKAEKKWKSLGSTIFSLKGAFAAVLGGYGVKKIASSFLDAAKTSENFRVRLEVLLGSTEEGGRLFKEMGDYAGRVPFQFEKVMGAATQLSGVMKGGVDEITQWMPMIGDLAAAAGIDIEKATEQVIRMYSAGAASADLFRERGILAMMGFKAGVSYSAEETRKMMMEQWNKADSQFRGVTDKMAKTWDGLISMISDKWFQLRNLIMDAGVFEELKTVLSDINDRFGKWLENNKEIIKQKVPEYVEKIKTALQKIWDILSYDPAIITWGLIGLAFWGKKGAVIVGGLAHMVEWVKNLSAALALAASGVVSFKEIVSANFKELEAIVKRFDKSVQGAMGNFVRMPIPKETLPTETWTKPKAGKSAPLPTETWISTAGIRTEEKLKGEYEIALSGAVNYIAEQYKAKMGLTLSETFQNWANKLSGSGDVWEKRISESGEIFYEKVTKTSQFAAIAMGQSALQFIQAAQAIVDLPLQIADAITHLFESIGNFGDMMTKAIDAVIESAFNMVKGIGDIFTKLIPRLITMVPEFILALVQGVPLFIQALADSVPLIIDAFIKQIPHIVGELVDAIWDMVNPFGAGPAGGKGFFGIDLIPDEIPILGWFHKGGIVGKTRTPKALVSPSALAGAKRYHTGLRPNEQVGIFEEGEEIIPKDRARRGQIIYQPQFINQGVITTNDVDRWFADRAERARNYKMGKQTALVNIALAGVDI